MNITESSFSTNLPYSPRVSISTIEFKENQKLFVVRDDVLPGGTKQRAIIPYLQSLQKKGFNHFIYLSHFCGFSQISLAHGCKVLGLKCTIFTTHDLNNELHNNSAIAKEYGAQIYTCASLDQAEYEAKEFVDTNLRNHLIPTGFHDEEFINILSETLQEQWDYIQSKFLINEVWLPFGSGALVNAFKKVIPEYITLHVVDLNILDPYDQKVVSIKNDKRVVYHQSNLAFHEVSNNPPPIQANDYYDAKVWEHIILQPGQNALWWNVAK